MPDLWRISNHGDLSGEGGRLFSARWHTAGHRVVYLAESPAGALLEVLVHLELSADRLPPSYLLLRVEVPDHLIVPDLPVTGRAWKTEPTITQALGDAWLHAGKTVLARVPSVILPRTSNVLLNPLHPHAKRISVAEIIPTPLDPRLL